MHYSKYDVITLDPDYLEKSRPRMDLDYCPEKVTTFGIELTCVATSGFYASLKLTPQETLALVKTLRQIPEIERATTPEKPLDVPALLTTWKRVPPYCERFRSASLECVESSSDLSDLACHSGHAADQTAQQP